jgi:hypothetical protein
MPYNFTTWADGFTFPPKKACYGFLFSLKNSSLSAGFEPVNHGYNDNHGNHYITENDVGHVCKLPLHKTFAYDFRGEYEMICSNTRVAI